MKIRSFWHLLFLSLVVLGLLLEKLDGIAVLVHRGKARESRNDGTGEAYRIWDPCFGVRCVSGGAGGLS